MGTHQYHGNGIDYGRRTEGNAAGDMSARHFEEQDIESHRQRNGAEKPVENGQAEKQ